MRYNYQGVTIPSLFTSLSRTEIATIFSEAVLQTCQHQLPQALTATTTDRNTQRTTPKVPAPHQGCSTAHRGSEGTNKTHLALLIADADSLLATSANEQLLQRRTLEPKSQGEEFFSHFYMIAAILQLKNRVEILFTVIKP